MEEIDLKNQKLSFKCEAFLNYLRSLLTDLEKKAFKTLPKAGESILDDDGKMPEEFD